MQYAFENVANDERVYYSNYGVEPWIMRSNYMNGLWKTSLWQQFGTAIDILDDATSACPEQLWMVPLWDVEPPAMRLPGTRQPFHCFFICVN